MANAAEMDTDFQQLNFKVPTTYVAGARRLAAKQGVPLHVYLTDLIGEALSRDADLVRESIEDERAEIEREQAALLAELDKIRKKQKQLAN